MKSRQKQPQIKILIFHIFVCKPIRRSRENLKSFAWKTKMISHFSASVNPYDLSNGPRKNYSKISGIPAPRAVYHDPELIKKQRMSLD